jgi:phage baseplate assembly protein W
MPSARKSSSSSSSAIIVVGALVDIRQDIGGAKRTQNGQGKNRKHYASNLQTLFINQI